MQNFIIHPLKQWLDSEKCKEFNTSECNDMVGIFNSKIILQWSDYGQLEWAPAIGGPWNSILPNPSAPYSESIDFEHNHFYRIKK